MKQNSRLFSIPYLAMPFVMLSFILLLVGGCQKNIEKEAAIQPLDGPGIAKPPQLLKDFNQVNLVGNNDEYDAAHIDPTLLNAWGLAFSGRGIPWVNANGTGLSEVYDKEGNILRPPVAIPSPTAATGGTPTGIVFNSTTDFQLPNGSAALFIFDGEDGVLSGWNGGDYAVRVVNNEDAVYKGLAIANSGGAHYLYAANFKTGNIDVFDRNWALVSNMPFHDPALPAGYAPFNIQNIDGNLYVLYAQVGEDFDEEAGPGKGYVDVYNAEGSLIKRLASKGQLNAPWGIAKAPAGFFSDDNSGRHNVSEVILVGNFGDGRINAFNMDGAYLGQLRAHGKPIAIEGLWAIMFPPPTATTVDPNRLYFTAGPDDEEDGLFGYLEK